MKKIIPYLSLGLNFILLLLLLISSHQTREVTTTLESDYEYYQYAISLNIEEALKRIELDITQESSDDLSPAVLVASESGKLRSNLDAYGISAITLNKKEEEEFIYYFELGRQVVYLLDNYLRVDELEKKEEISIEIQEIFEMYVN